MLKLLKVRDSSMRKENITDVL